MRIRNPRTEARYQKSRLISSLVAILAFALLAGIAFDRGFRAAAVFAVLLVLGTLAFAIMSWGRWADAVRALGEEAPPAPDANHGPSVAHEGQILPIPDNGQPVEPPVDADLDALSREELVEEVVRLRNAIRSGRPMHNAPTSRQGDG